MSVWASDECTLEWRALLDEEVAQLDVTGCTAWRLQASEVGAVNRVDYSKAMGEHWAVFRRRALRVRHTTTVRFCRK